MGSAGAIREIRVNPRRKIADILGGGSDIGRSHIHLSIQLSVHYLTKVSGEARWESGMLHGEPESACCAKIGVVHSLMIK